jgi:ergothioneine biosynthesis protein EgtB
VTLAKEYLTVRELTDVLAAPLSPEDQTVQSMPDVSPTKWHRAHVTWFFETFVLGPHAAGYEPFHPAFGYLFNSYYETVGERHPRPDRGLVTRPGAAEVGEYRAHVDEAMAELLDRPLPPEVADLVELGLHHEQQHQELLLMDIQHVLSINPMAPAYRAVDVGPLRDRRPLEWVEHPGGLVDVGAVEGDGFTFDNEHPRHREWLEPFELADRPVTNGEFQEFVDDGGYRRPDLWLSDGWSWVQARDAEAPLYWRDGTEFTLAGEVPRDPARPVVHVSYYEADAFARWAGARLPTEGEWEAVACNRQEVGRHLDLDRLLPDVGPPGDLGLFGDVWEWTASAYLPYPGFQPAAGAVGEYNGKFMSGQHVLRGGACVTPEGHTRRTYRNFFPPGAQWAYSGVRLAR